MKKIENVDYPSPIQNYKVLVSCFTYNQSKYIEDALNGFVMQQTTFPFVCLVMDDASTDGEQDIIKVWMERECDMSKAVTIDISTSVVIIVPHKTNTSCFFAFYLLKQNLYGTGKKVMYINPWREKCEYEAMCEGDDYWIDPLKLQKQVDFLEVNPEYGLTWTKAKRYEQQIEEYTIEIGEFAADFSDLLLKNPIPALTVVFRKDLLFGYDDFFKGEKLLMGDYPRWLYIAERSKIHFIDEVTSVYRFYPGSASRPSRRADLYKFNAGGYAIAMKFCENQEKYSLIYKKLSNNYFYWMSLNSICSRDFSAFSEYWSKFSFKTIQELAYFIGAFLYSFVRR